MPFKFRLQKLLEYRENQKKLAQEELARRQREVLSLQQEMLRLQGEEQRLVDTQRTCQGDKFDLFTFISMENYRCYLQKCYRERTEELQEAEKNMEQQREVVMESWRSCQVLSSLREKAQQNYREEEKISEQRLNDELGLGSYLRQDRYLDGKGVISEDENRSSR